MRVDKERVMPGAAVGGLKFYLLSTGQALSYKLLLPERMMESTHEGIKTKLMDHELDTIRIDFRDSMELEEFITVLTRFRDQIQSGLGRWENDWRLR